MTEAPEMTEFSNPTRSVRGPAASTTLAAGVPFRTRPTAARVGTSRSTRR